MKLLGSARLAEIAESASMHLAYNAEHVAPYPVLTSYCIVDNHLVVQTRDLGQGLESYLLRPGLPYSTRPYSIMLRLHQEQQGNGIMLTMNQVLNGCSGSMAIESSGQKIRLRNYRGEIVAQRIFGSKIIGTRFLLFLPLLAEWHAEEQGDDHFHMPAMLKIRFLPDLKMRFWHIWSVD
ncbi:MAG: hypothetical protein ABIB65_01800 [Candidatus Margulisiibacteriota bacterium]